MPASGVINLVDANVWLALSFSDHLHHTTAKNWFDAESDGTCAFCRVTEMALLRHLTNAKIMGKFVKSQREAWSVYDSLAQDPRVLFLLEPSSLQTGFREFSNSTSPSHANWTDAYLAAFAKTAQSQVVTFDRGFSRFPGLGVTILGA